MARPLAIDLFCGIGGWTKGFLAEGYRCVGFDLVDHGGYPGQLVLQDVRTIDGHRLSSAAVIVASPPCDDFSRWDQPWPAVVTKRVQPDLSLWRAAERIAREAGVPLVIENVRGAQKFMGQAQAHFAKQYLWGDVPALLPPITGQNFGRQKQSLSSTARARRAEVPFPLARWVANVFKPENI